MNSPALDQTADPPWCPACEGNGITREEVDIGVGTLKGPWRCDDCGWKEPEIDLGLKMDEMGSDDGF
jgi:DnaJ-class molecular chaperone